MVKYLSFNNSSFCIKIPFYLISKNLELLWVINKFKLPPHTLVQIQLDIRKKIKIKKIINLFLKIRHF